MLVTHGPVERISAAALQRSQDVAATPADAFGMICAVENWPVWLSFLRSARRLEDGPIGIGSEVAIRGAIPGDEEELYEVDRFLDGYVVSLVGAYSIRRRLDFRVEQKNTRSRVIVRLDYPAYGGALGALIDRVTARRKLAAALGESLIHFKGLVEFKANSEHVLADF